MKKTVGLLAVVVAVLGVSSGACFAEPQASDSSSVAARTRGATVTANKLWRCPNCNSVLEKGNLGVVWNAGDPISRVAGIATCMRCKSQFEQADVYGGMYDVEDEVTQAQEADFEGAVSMIVYQLSSTTPPTNARQICKEILKNKYPKATLEKFYCLGWTDAEQTPEEGLAVYKEFVSKGTLPDLGSQFGTFTGEDISGKKVVVLFFKK